MFNLSKLHCTWKRGLITFTKGMKRELEETIVNKEISATTYGTIALVGLTAFIGFLISGWDNIWSLLYFVLGIIIFAGITILLMKFIPEVWVMGLVAIGFIIFMHVHIESWMFTIFISSLAILFIFTHFKLHKNILSFSLFILMIVLYLYAAEFGGFHQEVNVTNMNMENVINEMEAQNGVTSTYLSVKDDMVYCTLDVEGTVTKEEAKNLGENCGSALANEVTEDDLDAFYEKHKLTLIIQIGESEDLLYGESGSNEAKTNWSKSE